MSDIIKESNSTKKYIPHMENIKNTAELLASSYKLYQRKGLDRGDSCSQGRQTLPRKC